MLLKFVKYGTKSRAKAKSPKNFVISGYTIDVFTYVSFYYAHLNKCTSRDSIVFFIVFNRIIYLIPRYKSTIVCMKIFVELTKINA